MKTEINLEDKQEIFKGIFQHQISNHPTSNLIRAIDYLGANISYRYKEISHDAEMHYFTAEGEHLPEFTHKVKQRGRAWKVDNSYEVIERNPNGTPNLDAEGEEQKHQAFDYFIQIVFNIPAPLKNIIQSSIDLDDANKLFD